MRKWTKAIFVTGAVVFAVMLSGGACMAKSDIKNAEIEQARQATEKICMGMKPYLERPDLLKGIKVTDESEINAYADQNNTITFFSGMLDFVRDDNEIAVVCGHEMAHVSAQHIKRSIFNSIASEVLSQGVGGVLGNVAGSALASKQSRKHEREADARGLLYMWLAGYDPRSAWKFWNAMANKMQSGDAAVQKYFGSHPVDKERIENFKVLLVRDCKQYPNLKYCDEIMADKDLLNLYNSFESR